MPFFYFEQAQMPSIRAVFFDAGFTLLKPVPDVADTYLEHARAVAGPVDEAAFRARLAEVWANGRHMRTNDHVTSDAIERTAWHHLTAEVAAAFPALRDAHGAWLESLFAHFDDGAHWRVMDGASQLLGELRRRGMKLVVVSNWHSTLHDILAHRDLTRHFDHVLTSAELGRRKPHPALFERALELADVRPDEALHIGDSLIEDVAAADSLGIRAVWFNPKGRDAPDDITGIGHLREIQALCD